MKFNYNKTKKLCIILCLFCFVRLSAQQWPVVHKEAKPWTRWWWMSSAVNKEGIDKQLSSLHNVGFGGVEVVPIYGAVGYEHDYIKYLSPDWMKVLDHTVSKARSLAMGVDISVGTGWPIGGPEVSVQDAATRLIIQQYSIQENHIFNEPLLAKDKKGALITNAKLASLIAYNQTGKTIDITDKVSSDGVLNWKDVKGDWELYAAFIGKTGQRVKRAAYGGEGFVLDHFSSKAVNNYFNTFDAAFGNNSHGVRSFYNDSYEVYDADWTPDFFDAFKKRRGYDLKPYLRNLVTKSKDPLTAAVKSDYRLTISDLLMDNFANKFTKWAHLKKALNTNESHGSPANLLDLYAAVDIPESEIYGSNKFDFPGIRRDSADIRNVDPDPIMLQFASSAAHVAGKKLVSNETFTWLTEHFKTSWSQCKPEVEQTFISGINHVFYHGTTYSPANISWPGWLFYASVNFVPENSLWPHIVGLNDYITRCQSVLQTGKADNEILSYWPVYDQWSRTDGLNMPFMVHNIDEWLYPTSFYKNAKSLQKIGYKMDFASDKMLSEAFVKNKEIKITEQGAAYKVLLVSQCEFMPLTTLQNIFKLANAGTTIVMQAFPHSMPGLVGMDSVANKKMRQLIASLKMKKINNDISVSILGLGRIILAQDVQKGLTFANLNRESLTDLGLQFIRRKINNGKYYYIINHTANTIDQQVPLNINAQNVYLLNPQTGATGSAMFSANQNTINVKLQLQPGESIIVQTSNNSLQANPYKYVQSTSTPIELTNNWDLTFSDGGPFIPSSRKLAHLLPWTNFTADSTTQSFAGSGTYATKFILNHKDADDYILSLDKLYESASVTVNGKEVGLIWSIPFKLNIGAYLKVGENEIALKVNNLMANRIAYMDRNNIEWKKYHEINFVNIDYKRFDASKWKVQPSGLDGKAIITPVYYLK